MIISCFAINRLLLFSRSLRLSSVAVFLVLALSPVEVKVKLPFTVFIFGSKVFVRVALAEVTFSCHGLPFRVFEMALSAWVLSTLGLIPFAFKLASNSAIPW